MSSAALRVLVFWLLAATACAALAQPLALPAPPHAQLAEAPGAQLPLELRAVDEHGTALRLGELVDGTRPVLLVPGYYRCPQLCGLVMRRLLDALEESGVPRARWRIVRVSIDPSETVADAHTRAAMDRDYADSQAGRAAPAIPLDMHLLTMQAADSQALARSVGFGFSRVDDAAAPAARFAHPATVVLLTPHGAVSRYLNGLDTQGGELRVALAEAAGDRIGAVSGRIALLCAHFAPSMGRHDDAVMTAARIVSAAVIVLLALLCLRAARRPAGSAE